MQFNISRLIMPFMILFSSTLLAQPKIDEKGVSLTLAKWRSEQLKNIRYDLSFSIPENIDAPINAVLNLKVEVLKLDNPLYLDFNETTSYLKTLEVNGKLLTINHYNEHIKIDAEHLKLGENTIIIQFRAGELSLNRNDNYLYTLLVPDRASTLFPSFDQPNLKARYTLTIKAPKGWEVMCGAPLLKQETKANYTTHWFEPSDLISTYLFSFVAGDFRSTKQPTYLNSRFIFRETDSAKVKQSIPKIFGLHENALRFLETYTNQNFPFKKLDYAAIPGFQYGGMEHLGAIQYRQSVLFLDESATINQQLSRGKLIAHEVAHMWFGNLVTMQWFDDVWLKEVFANFMADKIVRPSFPEIDHNLQFMFSHYPSAYNEDRTQGTTPIKQPLNNLKNAGSIYGNIIYNKAPIMMRQLEAVMGKKAFQSGLQEYIQKFKNSNANWNDLVAILDDKSAYDMRAWSDVWVSKSSRPIISEHITTNPNGSIRSFILEQTPENGFNKAWVQTFDIGLIYADSLVVKSVTLQGKQTPIKSLINKPKPDYIIYNYNGFGYGVFPVSDKAISNIPDFKNKVARGYAYINLYENFLNGTVESKQVYEIFLKGLKQETDPIILNYITSVLSEVFWQFTTVSSRKEVAQELEETLLSLLKSETGSDIKKAYFSLYKNTASTNKAKLQLAAVFNKTQVYDDLKLNQDDFIDIAFRLAILEHRDAEQFLTNLESEITNIDKLKRFRFIRPSVSSEVAVRDAFMASLSNPKQREKEAWVGSALNYLHHPLRQKQSRRYLSQSLTLLEGIQQTGDIFFPKRWLSNTLGNYTSQFAKQAVEVYLKTNTTLIPSLKNKVLQVADKAYRAENIKPF